MTAAAQSVMKRADGLPRLIKGFGGLGIEETGDFGCRDLAIYRFRDLECWGLGILGT